MPKRQISSSGTQIRGSSGPPGEPARVKSGVGSFCFALGGGEWAGEGEGGEERYRWREVRREEQEEGGKVGRRGEGRNRRRAVR